MIGRILIFITIIFQVFLYSEKIHPRAGTTSASFLKIPVGAYYSSLGGSVINDGEDLSSVFYNPSFAAGYRNKNFYLSHNFHISDIEQSYFAFGNRTKNIFLDSNSYYVFSLNYLSLSGLDRRSGLNESDPFSPSPVEGSFGADDIAVSFSYAFLYENLGLGFSLKYISQKIDNSRGDTLALDIGVVREIKIKEKTYNIDFGINNIGRGIKLQNERYKLPLSYRAGVWRDFEKYELRASFTMLKYIDNYPYFIIGLDKRINSFFSVRMGYKYRFYGNELGFWSGFSTGIGLVYNKFYIDYSLNPYGELGYSHKISLTFKF